MRAAVLQPTYLPWMGYFGMIDLADTFVFYDDVQFVKQSWQQRNKIKSPGGEWIWLSVHVIHEFGQNINQVLVNDSSNWSEKHWKSIYQSYAKAPFFKEFQGEIKEVYSREWKYLGELNIFIIRKLCRLFGVKEPKFVLSSELEDIKDSKTNRLLNVLGKIGAGEYICNPGSRSYIRPGDFAERGIKLFWYEYQHPVYPQIRGEFIPYLSAIDLLFNAGPKSVDFIRQGARDALKLDEVFMK